MQPLLLSIDLESFVHTGFDNLSSQQRQEIDDGYILAATEIILNKLRQANRHITFFVVSEIYDWYPDLITQIQADGHEIAWHTHAHNRIRSVEDLRTEWQLAENFLSQYKPQGFRAPVIHLTKDAAIELPNLGFRYSSSTYGSQHQNREGLWEIPVTSIGRSRSSYPSHLNLRHLSTNLPVGSGLFLSAVPKLSKYFLAKWLQNRSAAALIHPWQIVKPKALARDLQLNYAKRNPLFGLYLKSAENIFDELLQWDIQTYSQFIKNVA